MKFLIAILSLFLSAAANAEVNLYTDRSVELLQPLADDFESQTGIKVNILSGSSSEIVDRLNAEGQNTFADLIYVKDMVYLNEISQKGLFQAYSTEQPAALVEPSMRHPDKLWTAVTIRPRTLVYNTENKTAADVKNYVELAEERFKGRLCLRTSDSSYNVALVSSLIENMGYESAKNMIAGWVANLSPVAPTKNDGAALDAVAAGTCDVAVVNTYYLTQKLQENPGYPVTVTFANQSLGGVHVNGAGIGLSAYTLNPEGANSFIEFILSDKAQLYLSREQGDYPSKTGLLPETLVRDWGLFEADMVNWSVLGLQHDNAKRLFEEVGYL